MPLRIDLFSGTYPFINSHTWPLNQNLLGSYFVWFLFLEYKPEPIHIKLIKFVFKTPRENTQRKREGGRNMLFPIKKKLLRKYVSFATIEDFNYLLRVQQNSVSQPPWRVPVPRLGYLLNRNGTNFKIFLKPPSKSFKYVK